MIRLLAVAILALGACAQQQPVRSPGEAAAEAACRQQADTTVTRRERTELYREDAFPQGVDRDNPRGETDRMLRRVERDRLIEQCIRGADSGS